MFWKSAGDYNAQNFMLSALMTKSPEGPEETGGKIASWHYRFHTISIDIAVCQKFLCSLLVEGDFPQFRKR